MKPHPLTLAYLKTVAERPGMFMGGEFNLEDLWLQLFGYDQALADAGILGEFERFNSSFGRYLEEQLSLNCSHGWAVSLLQRCGNGESAFKELLDLVERAISLGHQARSGL